MGGVVTATEQLARYVADLDYSALPEPVIRQVKRAILDNVGCGLGGVQTDLGRAAAHLAGGPGFPGQSTILGRGEQVPAPMAAYINSYNSNVLDYDDTLFGHPGTNIVQPAIVLAELARASGQDLIRAVVAGYEVGLRITAAMWPSRERLKVIFPTSTFQTLGAVAAGAAVLRLTTPQVCEAFGIAVTGTPVARPTEKRGLRPWAKPNLGWSSLVGVQSALMAQAGFTGLQQPFDGAGAFWVSVGSDRYDSDQLTAELGMRYDLLALAFKPFSSCRWTHAPLDAVGAVVREHELLPQDIDRVIVRTMTHVALHLAEPRPQTMIDAQFSIPYVVAARLLGHPTGPSWYAPELLADPAIAALAGRIRVEPSVGADDAYYQEGKLPAEATVWTQDGRELTGRIDYARGEPANPLSDQDLADKFIGLAEPVLGGGQAGVVLGLIHQLEALDDVRELTARLRVAAE